MARGRPFALLLLLAGCSSLPKPTPEDVTRAQTLYPHLTLDELSRDRQTYVGTCGGCHALHLPSDFPAARWPELLDEMQRVQHVKLSVPQRKQIEQFLIAMAR
jgi:Dihaem cytochrome c